MNNYEIADLEYYAKNKENLEKILPEEIYNLFDNLCEIVKHDSAKAITKYLINLYMQCLLDCLEEKKKDDTSYFAPELIIDNVKQKEMIIQKIAKIKETSVEKLAEYIFNELTMFNAIIENDLLVEKRRNQIEEESKKILNNKKFNGEDLVKKEEGIGRIYSELNIPIIISLYKYIIKDPKLLKERKKYIERIENDAQYPDYKKLLKNIKKIICLKIMEEFLTRKERNNKEIEKLKKKKLKYIFNIYNTKTTVKELEVENETNEKIIKICGEKIQEFGKELIEIAQLYDSYYETDLSQMEMTGSEDDKIEMRINQIIKQQKQQIEEKLEEIKQNKLTHQEKQEMKRIPLVVNGESTAKAKSEIVYGPKLSYVQAIAYNEMSKKIKPDQANEILKRLFTRDEKNQFTENTINSVLNQLLTEKEKINSSAQKQLFTEEEKKQLKVKMNGLAQNKLLTDEEKRQLLEKNSPKNNYYKELGHNVQLPDNQLSKGYQKTLKILPPNKNN